MLLDDEPLVFSDPIGLLLLGDSLREMIRSNRAAYMSPERKSLRAALTVRHRFAEEMLELAVSTGVEQYVILAAGFDFFGWHPSELLAGLRVYEADVPAVLEQKRWLLAEHDISPQTNVCSVPCDLTRPDFLETLVEHGFAPDRKAFFSWLGCTQYVPKDSVFEVLSQIARSSAPGSQIVFDYKLPASTLPDDARVELASLSNTFSRRGEPWKTYLTVREIDSRLGDMGCSAVLHLGAHEVQARYLAGRTDGLRYPPWAALVCATFG
jgi:methyltransferase (TIGR00027 family)